MRKADAALREYETLLVDLHRLNAIAGSDAAAAARAVSDRMAGYEGCFDESDVDFLNGLSGDLYMLVDREVFDPDLVPDLAPATLRGRLSAALTDERWGELLTLLRAAPAPAPVQGDQVAYLRSKAYEGLGHLVPAVVFMDEAARRRPAAVNYPALALQLLDAGSMTSEAVRRAIRVIEDADSPPRVAIMAASVLCRQNMTGGLTPVASTAVARAVARLPRDLKSESLSSVLFVGHTTLAMFERQSGNDRAAADALARAVDTTEVAPGQALVYALATRERDLLRQGRFGSSEEVSVARSLMDAVPRAAPMAWAA